MAKNTEKTVKQPQAPEAPKTRRKAEPSPIQVKLETVKKFTVTKDGEPMAEFDDRKSALIYAKRERLRLQLDAMKPELPISTDPEPAGDEG